MASFLVSLACRALASVGNVPSIGAMRSFEEKPVKILLLTQVAMRAEETTPRWVREFLA
jgi:hypothetical protein